VGAYADVIIDASVQALCLRCLSGTVDSCADREGGVRSESSYASCGVSMVRYRGVQGEGTRGRPSVAWINFKFRRVPHLWRWSVTGYAGALRL